MLPQVVGSTTREGRFGEWVAAWVLDQLRARGDIEVEFVDLPRWKEGRRPEQVAVAVSPFGVNMDLTRATSPMTLGWRLWNDWIRGRVR